MVSRWPVLVVTLGVVCGTSLACVDLPPPPTQPSIVQVVPATNISAFPRRHAPGAVDVVVTIPDGRSVTISSGYTYQDVSLSVSATSVAPGAPLTIGWTAPSGRPALEGLGLFRVNDLDTPLWFASANGDASGSRTLPAPALPGQYVFGYLNADDAVVVQSAIVTVTAELQVQPALESLVEMECSRVQSFVALQRCRESCASGGSDAGLQPAHLDQSDPYGSGGCVRHAK